MSLILIDPRTPIDKLLSCQQQTDIFRNTCCIKNWWQITRTKIRLKLKKSTCVQFADVNAFRVFCGDSAVLTHLSLNICRSIHQRRTIGELLPEHPLSPLIKKSGLECVVRGQQTSLVDPEPLPEEKIFTDFDARPCELSFINMSRSGVKRA